MGLEREEIKIPHSLSQFSHPKKPNIFLRWQMKSYHGTNAALPAALCLGGAKDRLRVTAPTLPPALHTVTLRTASHGGM